MSNEAGGPSDGVLDDPARLPAADRAAVRAYLDAAAGVCSTGREVFEQAEAIFGGAQVPPAEFASWLHFAATMLGHDEYAARLAAAEPAMPWRTVWAWWRPAGRCVAQPERLSEYEAAFYECAAGPCWPSRPRATADSGWIWRPATRSRRRPPETSAARSCPAVAGRTAKT
ncbi:hypothetical protein [Streptomyces sp. NPDC048637]|uniref:hypothetical protein n=1 Tax=Streptomyces sp. NPDC048637 TaxID=3155636 RepID=UPI00343E2797